MNNDFPELNQAARPAAKKPSLGDPKVVETILSDLAREALGCEMAAAKNIITPQDVSTIEEKEIEQRAWIFLSRDKNYEPREKWNLPGKIDVFLAEELELQARGPETIVKTALAKFISEVRHCVDIPQNPDMPELQWKKKTKGIVSKYRDVFMGLSIPRNPSEAASGGLQPVVVTKSTGNTDIIEKKYYLGDPEVLEKILMDLAATSLNAHRAVASNFITIQDAAVIEEKEIEATAIIFLGRNRKFSVDANWNVPGVMDAFLAVELGIQVTGAENIIKETLGRFLLEVRQKLDVPNNPGLSETTWKPMVESTVAKFKNLFLGLPAVVEKVEPAAPLASVSEQLGIAASEKIELPEWITPEPPKPAEQKIEVPVEPELPVATAPVVVPVVEPAPAQPIVEAKAEEKIEPVVVPMPTVAPVKKPLVPVATPAVPASASAPREGSSPLLKWAAVLAVLAALGGVTVVSLRKPAKKIEVAQVPATEKAVEKPKAPEPKAFFLRNGVLTAADGTEVKRPAQNGGQLVSFCYDINSACGTAQFLVATAGDSFFLNNDGSSAHDLWLRDEAGNQRLIHQSVFHARFSPDGKKIAYTSSDCVLHICDLEGKELARTERAYDPNWSKDGNAIVFEQVPSNVRIYPAAALQLARFDWQSNEVTVLADGRFDDVAPQFHPSGKWILFIAGTRSGGAAFWKVSSNGGYPVQLTNIRMNEGGSEFAPVPYKTASWSEDGRWFVFDCKIGSSEQTWGMEFDEKNNLKQAVKIADGLFPQWTGAQTFVCQKRAGEGFELVSSKLPGS